MPRSYFEVYLANGIALQGYFPPPQALPLLLLKARDEAADHGPWLGWDHLAPQGLAVQHLAGDHNTIMHAPHAVAVAECIDQQFTPRAMPGFTA